MLQASLGGVPPFLAYAALGVALTALFAFVYMRLTAHDEMALIRQGNVAAALALGGNLLGFSLPLDRAIQQAANVADCLLWALIAALAQWLVYLVLRLLVPGLSDAIARGNVAAGVLLAAVAVVAGQLNAAAMTIPS